MLPFLKPKPVAGLIVTERKPDGSHQESHSDENEHEALEACMGDLMRAMNMKDEKAAAQAFKAAFEVCESYPHQESESEGDEQ